MLKLGRLSRWSTRAEKLRRSLDNQLAVAASVLSYQAIPDRARFHISRSGPGLPGASSIGDIGSQRAQVKSMVVGISDSILASYARTSYSSTTVPRPGPVKASILGYVFPTYN